MTQKRTRNACTALMDASSRIANNTTISAWLLPLVSALSISREFINLDGINHETVIIVIDGFVVCLLCAAGAQYLNILVD